MERLVTSHFTVSADQWYWINGQPKLRIDLQLTLEEMGIPSHTYWLELPEDSHRYSTNCPAHMFFCNDKYAVLLKLSL